MDDPKDDRTFPFIEECLDNLRKKRLANRDLAAFPGRRRKKNVDRNCFAAGSGPNWDMAQMSIYTIILLRIEALPEHASKEDVLKVLEECEPRTAKLRQRY
jgi:hypothetical protein